MILSIQTISGTATQGMGQPAPPPGDDAHPGIEVRAERKFPTLSWIRIYCLFMMISTIYHILSRIHGRTAKMLKFLV